MGLAIAGYLTYVHYAGIEPICAASGGCERVQSSELREARRRARGADRSCRLRGDPHGHAAARGDGSARRRVAGPGGTRLQPLPDLPRAVRDRRHLPVVRGQRGDHGGAGGADRAPGAAAGRAPAGVSTPAGISSSRANSRSRGRPAGTSARLTVRALVAAASLFLALALVTGYVRGPPSTLISSPTGRRPRSRTTACAR